MTEPMPLAPAPATAPTPPAFREALSRPLGRAGLLALLVLLLLAPAALFRDPIQTYRLHSDDFAYIAASRTLPEALANLFVPHNTHIVPAWRLVTWGVVAAAGRLANLQSALAVAAYGIFAATLLLTGRLVARETGRTVLGLGAMLGLGMTSVLESSATWYSSGQTLWAAFGILAALFCAQGYRRGGQPLALVGVAVACALAGGFWTIGHAAGPVTAASLWVDGRRRCRLAAAVPLLATTVAIVVALLLGGHQIDARISFHKRTAEEAANPVAGLSHTLQAIPENLVAENLGLEVEATPEQGAVLSALLGLAWFASLVRTSAAAPGRADPGGGRPSWTAVVVLVGTLVLTIAVLAWFRGRGLPLAGFVAVLGLATALAVEWRLRPSPLEAAGVVLMLAAYLVEWTFRGYLPFSSLRGVVPWYDTIPQVGLILFAAGWAGRVLGPPAGGRAPLTRGQALALLVLVPTLAVIHAPRVAALFLENVPRDSFDRVRADLPTPALRLVAGRALAEEYARRQRLGLARFDQAQAIARKLGIGRDAIAATFGRVDLLELPEVYDAIGFLDVPRGGSVTDPARIRAALGPLLTPSPKPILGRDERGGFDFVQ